MTYLTPSHQHFSVHVGKGGALRAQEERCVACTIRKRGHPGLWRQNLSTVYPQGKLLLFQEDPALFGGRLCSDV